MEKRQFRLQLSRGISYRHGHLTFRRGHAVPIVDALGNPDEGLYNDLLRSGYLSDPDQIFAYQNPRVLQRLNPGTEVVVIRDVGMGDVLMVSLSLRKLAQVYPRLKFTYATSTVYVPMFRDCDFLHRVVPIVGLIGRHDWVLDLRGYSERTENRFKRGRIDLFADHLGVVIDDYRFPYRVHPDEARYAKGLLWSAQLKRPIIGLTIRGSTAVRTWPFGHVRKFAQLALAQGWSVVTLDHTPHDIDVPGVLNLTQKLSIRELAAVLDACDLVIAPDTGTVHLAEAVGTPCLALYSTIDPMLRLSHYSHVRAIWKGGPSGTVPCAPCHDQGCSHLSCLTQITPEEVMDASEETLSVSPRAGTSFGQVIHAKEALARSGTT